MVDRKKLQEFLETNAQKPELIPPAMELIEPLFRIAEAGRYALAPADDVHLWKAVEAINLAAALPVNRIVPVSAAAPGSWSDRRIDDEFHDRLRDSLVGSLADSLKGDEELWVGLGLNYLATLGYILTESLPVSLRRFGLWDGLLGSLRVSPRFLLGFAVAGNEEKVARLTPLMCLLPRAIPIGQKADEPGTWLVLFA